MRRKIAQDKKIPEVTESLFRTDLCRTSFIGTGKHIFREELRQLYNVKASLHLRIAFSAAKNY